MIDVLDFFSRHWFLAFLSMCFLYGIFVRLVRLPSLLINGYPPEHCDADGDLKTKPTEEE